MRTVKRIVRIQYYSFSENGSKDFRREICGKDNRFRGEKSDLNIGGNRGCYWNVYLDFIPSILATMILYVSRDSKSNTPAGFNGIFMKI